LILSRLGLQEVWLENDGGVGKREMRREGLVRHHLPDTKHLTEEFTTLTRVKLQRAQSRHAFIVAVEGGVTGHTGNPGNPRGTQASLSRMRGGAFALERSSEDLPFREGGGSKGRMATLFLQVAGFCRGKKKGKKKRKKKEEKARYVSVSAGLVVSARVGGRRNGFLRRNLRASWNPPHLCFVTGLHAHWSSQG